MRTNRIGGAVILGAALLLGTTASADVSLYSYPQAGEGPGTWQSMEGGLSRLAQTFTTGTSALNLSSVEIWIRNASEDDFDSTAGTLSIDLFATDGAGQPTGSSLYSIASGVSINAWYNNAAGFPGTTWSSLGYALSPNTTYAIEFAPSSSTTISWRYPNSGTPTSDITPTPTFHNWQSNGSSWADADPANGFSMNVTAVVPEPTVAGVFALGGALMVALRRRRPV